MRLNIGPRNLQAVPAILRRALELYQSTTYKDHFPFLDHFRRLGRGSPLVPALNSAVGDLLGQRQSDIGFAVPDEFNFYNLDHFLLSRGRREVPLDELTSEAVYEALDELDAWRDPLRLVRVVAHGEDDIATSPKPLHDYVVATVQQPAGSGEEGEYSLTAGAWFKIDADYAATLNRIVDRVEDVTDQLALPGWDEDWLKLNVDGKYGEERYNRHVHEERRYALVDRTAYRGAAGQRIETCDLLTKDKQLICVKRLDGSDKMAHLFEQGSVSAALMVDENYRNWVMQHFITAGGSGEFGSNSDWTFIFAIATSRPGHIKDLLPFFAKASLKANLAAIEDRGFRVQLTKVDRVQT